MIGVFRQLEGKRLQQAYTAELGQVLLEYHFFILFGSRFKCAAS